MAKNIRHIMLLIVVLMQNITVMAEYHTPDFYDTQVRKCFKERRWEQGKQLLDEAMEDYSGISAINELMGWYYYHHKKYTQARYYLVRSINDDKSNLHAHELIVNVEEETRNYSSAICYINEILELNPYDRGWWRRKIYLYRVLGNNTEADRLLNRLRQIYPNDKQIRKDVLYQQELTLAAAKKRGDMESQVKALQEILKTQPNNADYYLMLCNLLIQQGKTGEAADVAGDGVRVTRSAALVRKRVGILTEQNRYQEAINYIRECQRTYRVQGMDKLVSDIELEMTQRSVNNDPYIMYGKLYEKTHSAEALNFLINTSISRGYYEDALNYLRAAAKSSKPTEKQLYQLYLVNHRLGNRQAERRYLAQLTQNYPKNQDAREALCEMSYEDACNSMHDGQYGEALPQLMYADSVCTDKEMHMAVKRRLFTCHMEMRRYDQAEIALDSLKGILTPFQYLITKSDLKRAEGKKQEALALLVDARKIAENNSERILVSSQYEEIAVPYVKELMNARLYTQAYKAIIPAMEICPTSTELLHYALTCSAMLDKKDDYIAIVAKARTRYPEDPFYIAKEAGIYTMDSRYEEALELIRPLLDVYIGDSTLIGAYSENSQLLADTLMKRKKLHEAMSVVDTALVFDSRNSMLLYTKGVCYEKMHIYDSAHIYQKHYIPDAMEMSSFRHHLQELLAKTASNQLVFDYTQWRPGSNPSLTANAMVQYTRRRTKNEYTFSAVYAGREGTAGNTQLQKEEQEHGGTGIQVGAAWKHRWKPTFSTTFEGDVATKYMPQFTLKAAAEWELRNDWTVGINASYRRVTSYGKNYEWRKQLDSDDVVAGDSVWVYMFTGYHSKKENLFSAGATVSKMVNQFLFLGSANAFYLQKDIFWNAGAKMQFFPADANHSHFYVMAGLGTAPESDVIDRSLPSGFSDLNTYVGMGGLYVINRSISFGLSGLWYTMYNNNEKTVSFYVDEKYIETYYKNMFHLTAQVILTF